ncbi:iron complex transport system substrate-binding protein [Flagellimonas taeanensis]|uniref:Iron complex transport system substrate-binding protein n=1 Tax=Flagellimonas taeanensis TaxID=1005926 RepID=A0A1M7BRT6_9FLAO|nr:ABC transporter substrate-binding protein [Allomuricauda taeanensis]SFC48789.1 iron complex transport system substrate-binding protein [Allomuricauda taeanensis]SHL57680.1 iron complex transport system substrate-binding protein [Allomuricauda taeanensis]
MGRKQLYIGFIFALLILIGCGEKKVPLAETPIKKDQNIRHATGFTIHSENEVTIIKVTAPWPGAQQSFTYALVPKEKLASMTFPRDAYDAIVAIPVEKMVITSTTHIPSLEALDELNVVVGFPNTDFISSPKARELVDNGQIKELGMNESINTEIALALKPEVVMGFGINDTNKAYETIKQAGIAVVYNGDWVEQTPLGKAEWIKFFAPFFQKEQQADRIFKEIETSYMEAKQLAQKATEKPSVLTGGLYKDVWYVAGGQSWMAQFLNDANANYLWADTEETGSIGLSLESVLEKAQQADFWLNPSSQTSYAELESVNPHHKQFEAFTKKKIYSNAIEKGAKGGLIFYELAPQRPDLVLKDLITILHPGLLPDHEPRFFKPLH